MIHRIPLPPLSRLLFLTVGILVLLDCLGSRVSDSDEDKTEGESDENESPDADSDGEDDGAPQPA